MNESDAEVHMNCSGHRSKRETLMSHIGDESITKAVGVKWHCRPCGTGAMTKKDANIHADSKRHKDIKSNAGPMTKFDSRIHVKSAFITTPGLAKTILPETKRYIQVFISTTNTRESSMRIQE
jgi:hypothetical protein